MMKYWSGTFAFLLLAALVAAQQQARPATFEINGMVVDSLSGQPLAGVHVGVAPVTARNDFHIIITGEDGRFAFDGLVRGKYVLTAQRKGYITQSFDQHGQYSTSIAVGPDLDARNLVFRIRPQASISGQVLDEHNEPVRNARLILFQQSAPGEPMIGAVRSRTTTDDQGFYSFAHLSPEKYSIAVEADPWYAQRPPVNVARVLRRNVSEATGPQDRPAELVQDAPRSPLDVAYPLTYYPGVTDAASAGSIAVAAGEKFTADIILQPVPTVHTRIAMPTPGPKQHLSGNIRQRVLGGTLSGIAASATEVSPGVLEISGVAPGHYELELSTSDEAGGSPSISKGEIDLGSIDEVRTSWQPAASASVSGVVKLDTGEDASSRSVVILRNHKSGVTSVGNISESGGFEIQGGVQPGSYDLNISAPSQVLLSEVTATGAKVAGHTVEIKGSGPVKLTLVLTRGLAQVNGVALTNEKPAAGMMIVLVPQDPLHHPQLFRRDQSDSDGTFTLASIVPGKYTVLAIADGWDLDYKNPEVLKPYLPQGTPIQAEAKGKYDIKLKAQ